MRRTIQYFQDPETHLLITRVGSYVAVPILSYKEMLSQGDFKNQFPLKKCDVIKVSRWYKDLIPISNRKIRSKYTIEWINYHRQFWGLEKLPRVKK